MTHTNIINYWTRNVSVRGMCLAIGEKQGTQTVMYFTVRYMQYNMISGLKTRLSKFVRRFSPASLSHLDLNPVSVDCFMSISRGGFIPTQNWRGEILSRMKCGNYIIIISVPIMNLWNGLNKNNRNLLLLINCICVFCRLVLCVLARPTLCHSSE